MGEWFDFNFRFEHRKGSMSQLLLDNGVAVLDVNDCGYSYLKIDIKKLCPEIYDEINKENIAKGKELLEQFGINYEGNGLQYYSKWVMDETILNAVSHYFKDDVIYAFDSYSGNGNIYSYFVKNGQVCLRDGTLAVDCIHGLSPSCIHKINDNNYQVSIPIGEDDDKWGAFSITKNNLEWCEYVCRGVIYPERQEILLAGNIEVKFKRFSKTYTAKELAEAYYASKNAFYNKMHEDVILSGLNNSCIKKRSDSNMGSDYYVVKIACNPEISEDCLMSIAVSEYDVKNFEDDTLPTEIVLGQVGKPRNVQVFKNGKYERTMMKPLEIKMHYESTTAAS